MSDAPLTRVCAWCGETIEGDPEGAEEGAISHGICAPCLADTGIYQVEDLLDLKESDADVLPFGMLALDDDGRVLKFNAVEESLSGLSRERVLGRDFFHEVAPCTRVADFEGRFRRLVAEAGVARESFNFIFRFAGGARFVDISMTHRPGEATIVLVRPSPSEED